ncbi:exopolyphosphatase [Arcanobacterium hippocoleae]
MKVAGIDCGTNTVRLLISEVDPGKKNVLGGPVLKDIVRTMEVVRLGAGVDRTGKFNDAALERTLRMVEKYALLCREHEVESIRFAATSATRDAENRDIFIDGVRNFFGVRPQVLTGKEEARTSFIGAVCALDGNNAAQGNIASPMIAVDLGGGSTELALGTAAGDLLASYSMDVGSVRMHERHLGSGKASAEKIAAAREDVRHFLDLAEKHVDFGAARALIGLAGTVTSITAQWLGLAQYDSARIHGAVMTLAEINEICDWFLNSSLEQRLAISFMHPGRADVINAGALVWQEVVNRVAQRTAEAGNPLTQAVTSEHDILDGLALWAAADPQQPKFR